MQNGIFIFSIDKYLYQAFSKLNLEYNSTNYYTGNNAFALFENNIFNILNGLPYYKSI